MRKAAAFFWFGLAVAGCSATGGDIDAVDADRFTPMVRVTVDLDKLGGKTDEEVEPEEQDSEPPENYGLAEFSLSYVGARDRLGVSAGDELRLGDLRFPGPAVVEAEIDQVRLTAMARLGFPLDESFSIEALLGVSVLYVDTDLESGGLSESEVDGSVGPIVGAQVSFRPFEPLMLYGRGTLAGGLDTVTGRVISGEAAFEGGFEVSGLGPFYLFGGWRASGLHEVRDGSDLFLDVSGPFAGLGLRF